MNLKRVRLKQPAPAASQPNSEAESPRRACWLASLSSAQTLRLRSVPQHAGALGTEPGLQAHGEECPSDPTLGKRPATPVLSALGRWVRQRGRNDRGSQTPRVSRCTLIYCRRKRRLSAVARGLRIGVLEGPFPLFASAAPVPELSPQRFQADGSARTATRRQRIAHAQTNQPSSRDGPRATA